MGALPDAAVVGTTLPGTLVTSLSAHVTSLPAHVTSFLALTSFQRAADERRQC
jgi:hypothetical protein